jgi:ATP-dependent DNA helicase RecQ
LLADGAPDGPVPDEVFVGVVETLAAWARGADAWPQRPVGVVTVGSRRRPRLVASLGERIAAVGRLPLLGTVEPVGPPAAAATRVNSAQRVRALHEAFAAPTPGTDGPILLVDDLVDTGWTMTLAARLLRRAGAPAVLPFALALAG